MAAAMPALGPAAPPARPRMLLIATGLAAAASSILIAVLLGAYLFLRDQAGGTTAAFLPEGVSLPLGPANIAAGTIAMAAVMMQWAVYAIARDDRRNTYVALGLTAVLAAAFINAVVFQLGNMGAPLADSSYSVLVHTVVGLHLAMYVGALLMLGIVAFRTLGGQYSRRDPEGLAATALYWHVVTVLFLPVWLIVFVVR